MSSDLTATNTQNHINNLMKCMVKTEQSRKQSNQLNKDLKFKLNNSIDNLITKLKTKQTEINDRIDEISSRQQEKILNVEYEIQQLIGNLATCMVIPTTADRLYFMPMHLDVQTNQINEKIDKLGNKQMFSEVSQIIDDTIKTVEKSFDTFDKEKFRLNDICKKIAKSPQQKNTLNPGRKYDFSEWLYKPNRTQEFVHDDRDYLYLLDVDSSDKPQNNINSKIDFMQDVIHVFNSTKGVDDDTDLLDCAGDSIEILDEHLASFVGNNQSFKLNKTSATSTSSSSISINEKSLSTSSLAKSTTTSTTTTPMVANDEAIESNNNFNNDGFSKVWHQMAVKPKEYWLAK